MRPSFIVIGAEKSGTTSLYRYLHQHPDIYMPEVKQLNHFIHHPKKRSLFQGPDVTYKGAIQSRDDYFHSFASIPEGLIAGELTHIYLYAEESPELIHEALGNVKIIAIIRNPVDRAFAQYVFHKKLNIEPLSSFEEVIEIEPARIRAGWDPVYHYINRGFYGAQLERYYQQFPAASIRVYKFESFFSDLAASLSNIYEFIGVDSSFLPDLNKKHLPGGDPRSPDILAEENVGVPDAKPVAQETKKQLQEAYRADIHKVMKLTGLDLSDWLK